MSTTNGPCCELNARVVGAFKIPRLKSKIDKGGIGADDVVGGQLPCIVLGEELPVHVHASAKVAKIRGRG
jgi:hypothetical protein